MTGSGGPFPVHLLCSLLLVALLLAQVSRGRTTLTVLCAPPTEFDEHALPTDNHSLSSIAMVSSDTEAVPVHCRAELVWSPNTTSSPFGSAGADAAASIFLMLEVKTYRSPTLFAEGLTEVRRDTVVQNVTDANTTTAGNDRNATLWCNATIAGTGLWRLSPALYIVMVASNGTTTSVHVEGLATVLDRVRVVSGTHIVLRLLDGLYHSPYGGSAPMVELLPVNGTLAVSSTSMYLRVKGALMLSSCAAVMTLSTNQDAPDTVVGSDLAPTTVVAPLDFTNGSFTLLHMLTNPFATDVVAAYANINLTCWIPQQTLLLLEQEQLVRNAMLNATASPYHAASNVLFDVPVSVSHALYVLPRPSVVLFPPHEDVTKDDGTEGPRSFPFQILVSTAKPTRWASMASTGATVRGLNVSHLLVQSNLSIGVFVFPIPSAMDELLLLQLGERAAQSGSVFVQASVVRETEASAFAAVTVSSGVTSLCAYSQMLSNGVAVLSFERSPVTCVVYRFSDGVDRWVYQLIAVLLAVLFAVVLVDDLMLELHHVRQCKKRGSVSRAADLRKTVDSCHAPMGEATLNFDNLSALVPPTEAHGAPGPVGLRDQHTSSSLSLPLSSNRAAYLRCCAVIAALWDVVSIAVSVVFVVVCLIRGRFLSLLLGMVGTLLIALVALALRVHVTLFAMPSRLVFRDGAPSGTTMRTQEQPAQQLRVGRRNNRRRRNNDPDRMDVCITVQAAQHTRGTPARCPLAAHFWPGVNLFVLAVDATGCELRFTEPARAFWFGVQRWVHDVPALVVALVFTFRYPTATNAASVAQIFCSAAAIVVGYRGVLVAVAVPLLVAISRCVSSLRASNIEEWVRGRTGLHVVAASEARHEKGAPAAASAAEAAKVMASLATPHVATLHARTFSTVSSIPQMSVVCPAGVANTTASFLGSSSITKSASPMKHGGRATIARTPVPCMPRHVQSPHVAPDAAVVKGASNVEWSAHCVGVDTPRNEGSFFDAPPPQSPLPAHHVAAAPPSRSASSTMQSRYPSFIGNDATFVSSDPLAAAPPPPTAALQHLDGSHCHGSSAVLPVTVVYSDHDVESDDPDLDAYDYVQPPETPDDAASDTLPSTLASSPSRRTGAAQWDDEDEATVVVHASSQLRHMHQTAASRGLRNVRGRHPIPYPLWTPLTNPSMSQA